MENTWLIGRTWKPREGWSRPVLTVERQHYTPAPSRGGRNKRKHHSDDREAPLHVTWINPSVASTIRSPTHHTSPHGRDGLWDDN